MKGRETVGTNVDIWSLGVMLYEMVQVSLMHRFSETLHAGQVCQHRC